MRKVYALAFVGTLAAAGLYAVGRVAAVLDDALADIGDATWV
jgi:hypothetical protein